MLGPVVVQKLLLVLLGRLLGRELPVGGDRTLELRRGHHLGELEQLRLVLGVGDAHERADFRVRDLAAGERRVDERQVVQALRDALVRARLPGQQGAAPREPGGEGRAFACPRQTSLALGRKLEQPANTGIDVRGLLSQRLLELLVSQRRGAASTNIRS